MKKNRENNLKNKKCYESQNQIYLYYLNMIPNDTGVKIILGTAIASIIFVISFYIYILVD